MGSIRTDVVSTKRKSLYCQFLTKGLRPPSGIPFIHRSGGGGRGRKMTCQEFSSAIGGLRTETDVAGRRSCPAARAGAEPGREPRPSSGLDPALLPDRRHPEEHPGDRSVVRLHG